MLTEIQSRLAALPAPLQASAERLFHISIADGRTIPPREMEDWIVTQFGSLDDVCQQKIVKIINRLTLEGAVFNPLRARRPSDQTGGDEALAERIAQELDGRDFFRDPLHDTTADPFGRIQGRYSMTASNVAKFEGWHGLVIFEEPHPLNFTYDQLYDYFDVGLRWLAAAHQTDPAAIYPMIGWNCLPKSGATIVHGHMHVTLGKGMAYSRIEALRRALVLCAADGGDYFAELFALHDALGLSLALPGVQAFAHLTPLRNREVILLLPNAIWSPAGLPAPVPTATQLMPVLQGLYQVLHQLIHTMGMRAFNVGMYLPPLGPTTESWENFPLVVRLADRGTPLTSRNDWGVMELFAIGCVTADPFEVAQQLRDGLDSNKRRS